MPALLERPKLSSAMARALHRHVMVERERKRQEEEEVDKMMEQKMKEEQERRRKKEMEERMSLEETKEQILKLQEKLQALQEEKHQLFLQLKKVLHEEEKRRRKEQSDMTTLAAAAYQQGMAVHAGTHILNMQGSPGATTELPPSSRLIVPSRCSVRRLSRRDILRPSQLSRLAPRNMGSTRAAKPGTAPTPWGRASTRCPSATPAASPSEARRLSPRCSICPSNNLVMPSTVTSPLPRRVSSRRAPRSLSRSSWNTPISSPDFPIRRRFVRCTPRPFIRTRVSYKPRSSPSKCRPPPSPVWPTLIRPGLRLRGASHSSLTRLASRLLPRPHPDILSYSTRKGSVSTTSEPGRPPTPPTQLAVSASFPQSPCPAWIRKVSLGRASNPFDFLPGLSPEMT
ncbi:G protein pathway suppressor 2 isoform X2 [Pantherophis guttatus]|uniref:G protein pathway suppressor 2 isoform X2 n=1 Tax=Pantherophis guttatus TaxID=94885 RepID=A0ABM3YYK3_PANGU|nr:G protein pathway suppressor 2 isoform X2 [Pantherophis guttatus]